MSGKGAFPPYQTKITTHKNPALKLRSQNGPAAFKAYQVHTFGYIARMIISSMAEQLVKDRHRVYPITEKLESLLISRFRLKKPIFNVWLIYFILYCSGFLS